MDRHALGAAQEAALRERAQELPKGWRMIVHPDPGILPAPLADREVDAVAIGEEAGIVYEIILGRRALQDASKRQYIDELRKRVGSVPGWRFELVILPDPAPTLAPLEHVRLRLERARELVDRAPSDAFFNAFVCVEWSLAIICQALGIDYQPNARVMAAALAESGVLDESDFFQIRSWQSVRNNLAHAMDFDPPTVEEVHRLISFAEALLTRAAEIPRSGDASQSALREQESRGGQHRGWSPD